MAETVPPSNEPTNVVTLGEFKRLQRRTMASLTFSALAFVLLVVGAIIHHHRHHRFTDRDECLGGCFDGHCLFDGGERFHHFGAPGWGPQRGFDQQGENGPRGGNFGGGPGGPPPGMPGMGGPMGKPDPATMTDGILNHLSTTLSLTDDQKARIKPIIEQQVAEIQKQMEAQRQAMQKQIEDGKAKIRPFLTADQQKQLDAMPLPGQKSPPQDEAQKTGP